MTQVQRDAASRMTWPLVALVGLGVVFFIGVFVLIPDDMPEARTGLLGFLMTSCASVLAVVVQRLATRVEVVQQQNDGQVSALLAAKTLPADQPIPLSALMCTPCPGHEGKAQFCRYPLCGTGEDQL